MVVGLSLSTTIQVLSRACLWFSISLLNWDVSLITYITLFTFKSFALDLALPINEAPGFTLSTVLTSYLSVSLTVTISMSVSLAFSFSKSSFSINLRFLLLTIPIIYSTLF